MTLYFTQITYTYIELDEFNEMKNNNYVNCYRNII